jgi:hypothetical protein
MEAREVKDVDDIELTESWESKLGAAALLEKYKGSRASLQADAITPRIKRSSVWIAE